MEEKTKRPNGGRFDRKKNYYECDGWMNDRFVSSEVSDRMFALILTAQWARTTFSHFQL